MTDPEFKKTIERSQDYMKRAMDELTHCTNDKGQYPQIDFSDIILTFQGIITGLEQSRKPQRKIILLP